MIWIKVKDFVTFQLRLRHSWRCYCCCEWQSFFSGLLPLRVVEHDCWSNRSWTGRLASAVSIKSKRLSEKIFQAELYEVHWAQIKINWSEPRSKLKFDCLWPLWIQTYLLARYLTFGSTVSSPLTRALAGGENPDSLSILQSPALILLMMDEALSSRPETDFEAERNGERPLTIANCGHKKACHNLGVKYQNQISSTSQGSGKVFADCVCH